MGDEVEVGMGVGDEVEVIEMGVEMGMGDEVEVIEMIGTRDRGVFVC